MSVRRAIILGAAGRDFHNFNVFFRNNEAIEVVAFTATQIPFIADRTYPPELAGPRYPRGIPIYDEGLLPELIERLKATDVYFAYSDVSHEHVMHLASLALSRGCSFHILGPLDTCLEARLPVLAVTASRTGAGKSTISRSISLALRSWGWRPAIIRHPMPYGALKREPQLYRSEEDLARANLTVEELEEYEGHVANGFPVLAGVDYELVLRRAEQEGDIILWDGGNNDFPFIRPTVHITVVDPTRPGHEAKYHPGEANVRMADIVVINKVNVARPEDVGKVEANVRRLNPSAPIVKVRSEARLRSDLDLRGKRVLAVEDGPTVTHGEVPEGAAALAAKQAGAVLVDPRPYAVGSIKETYSRYPFIGPVLPALGYSGRQLKELEEVIGRVPCDAVVLGTPANLARLIRIGRPIARVTYEAEDAEARGLRETLLEVAARKGLALRRQP